MGKFKLKSKVLKVAMASVAAVGCFAGISLNLSSVTTAKVLVLTEEQKQEKLKRVRERSYVWGAKVGEIYNFAKTHFDRSTGDCLGMSQDLTRPVYMEDGSKVEQGPKKADLAVYVNLLVDRKKSYFTDLKPGDHVIAKVFDKKTGVELRTLEAEVVHFGDIKKNKLYKRFFDDPLIEKAHDPDFVRQCRQIVFDKMYKKFSKIVCFKVDLDEKIKCTDINHRVKPREGVDYVYDFKFFKGRNGKIESNMLASRFLPF